MIPLLVALILTRDVTPEKTVRSFVDALNAHDFVALGRQVVGAKPGNYPFTGVPKLKAVLGESKIDGNDAVIVVMTEFDSSPEDSKYQETVHLRKVDGDWRIVPAASLESSKKPEPISIFAFIATKPESFALAKKAAKKTVDLSNVKQVALATIMYAADHNDRLPTAKGFKPSILPYLRSAEILTAPDAPKGTVSYFLDPRLSGMLMASIAGPSETAMIIEGTPAKTAYPWKGKTPLGYADGHAKIVDASLVLKARTISLK